LLHGTNVGMAIFQVWARRLSRRDLEIFCLGLIM
jgi:hypothetical protein